MKVRVEQVAVKVGSTIGFILGRPVDDSTKVVIAAADWRAAQDLGEAIVEANEPLEVEIPDWAVLEILELP